MAVIRLGGFRGELPRIHPRLLPTGASQTATNVRVDSGALESLRALENLQPTKLVSPLSLHRYSSTVWLESTSDVDWVPYPVANDAFGRLIFADPDASPAGLRVTDASLVGAVGYPGAWYQLEVPPPAQGFAAALVGTADDEDEVPETRYYVCTFVNSWGAEGPPSPPSNQVEWRTGQTVALSALPSVPVGNYNITYRRVYRLNTGSTGTTNYQFVTEIRVGGAVNASISAITQANPVVVTAVAHGLTEGQEATITGLGGEATLVIASITKSNPPIVETTTPHSYATGEYVELTNLGSGNGMDELNDVRNIITLVNDNKFSLDSIVAADYVAYNQGAAGGTVARTAGMDELDDNSYFTSVVDADNVSLLGIDGTGYYGYYNSGSIAQVAGTSYVDGVPSANLAEVLPTELYDPPNAATVGVRAHPAGFLAGFFGNTLAFSEPGAPHAWPIDYRFVTNSDIVGLGVFGGTIAIVTEGWPYLAVGSDPAAMTLVELEIEQACVAKRGMVDFGTAIAYPSPDGLIVVSGQGATNATSGIFTRDQWQALVPTTFVAFNWEQSYLCFYNDGSVTRAFILNPFDPAGGVVYVSKYATAGYKDLEEDLLYMVVSDEIEKWDQGAELTYTWKSRPTYTPKAVNMAAAKVIADAYPVTFELYVDEVKRFTKVVGSLEAFRLPGGYLGEKHEIIIKGTRRVSEVTLATTMRELSATV